jgi:hypothetical protein
LTNLMMIMDVPPDPRGIGASLSVVLLVIGLTVLLAAGLVVFLWYRKRSLRAVDMIRPDTAPAVRAAPAQPNKPNQP